MIAIDTNLLVYAHRRECAEHAGARRVLDGCVRGGLRWAIPWPCCYEFLSVMTNRRIWKDRAAAPEVAWRQLAALVGSPSNVLIGETEGFVEILGGLASRPRVRGAVVHDARIAAICLAHGVEALLTRDRDFSLFPELRIRDPLASS